MPKRFSSHSSSVDSGSGRHSVYDSATGRSFTVNDPDDAYEIASQLNDNPRKSFIDVMRDVEKYSYSNPRNRGWGDDDENN